MQYEYKCAWWAIVIIISFFVEVSISHICHRHRDYHHCSVVISTNQPFYSKAFRKGAIEPISSQSGMALPLNFKQDSAQVCP